MNKELLIIRNQILQHKRNRWYKDEIFDELKLINTGENKVIIESYFIIEYQRNDIYYLDGIIKFIDYLMSGAIDHNYNIKIFDEEYLIDKWQAKIIYSNKEYIIDSNLIDLIGIYKMLFKQRFSNNKKLIKYCFLETTYIETFLTWFLSTELDRFNESEFLCFLDNMINQCLFNLLNGKNFISDLKKDRIEKYCEYLENKLSNQEGVLRSLAYNLGVGGYNSLDFDPEEYKQKINWGIDNLVDVSIKLSVKRAVEATIDELMGE